MTESDPRPDAAVGAGEPTGQRVRPERRSRSTLEDSSVSLGDRGTSPARFLIVLGIALVLVASATNVLGVWSLPGQSEARREAHGFRRKIIGTVVSAKMAKTVVVEVIRKAMHPVYKKYVRVRNKYKAHDELNQYKAGDKVEIMEHAPISRQKRWAVTRLISRPVEA